MRIIALCCRIMITRDELEYYFYTDQVTRHIFKLHMCLFHETAEPARYNYGSFIGEAGKEKMKSLIEEQGYVLQLMVLRPFDYTDSSAAWPIYYKEGEDAKIAKYKALVTVPDEKKKDKKQEKVQAAIEQR